MNDIIDRINNELIVTDIISMYNLADVKATGNCECKMHSSKSKNSFKIYKSTNSFCCFACNSGGRVLDAIGYGLNMKKGNSKMTSEQIIECIKVGCGLLGIEYDNNISEEQKKHYINQDKKFKILSVVKDMSLNKIPDNVTSYIKTKRNFNYNPDKIKTIGFWSSKMQKLLENQFPEETKLTDCYKIFIDRILHFHLEGKKEIVISVTGEIIPDYILGGAL